MLRPFLHSVGLGLTILCAFGVEDAVRILELERRLEVLDQKYRLLEKKLENGEHAEGQTSRSLSIGAEGFNFRSADTNFVLRIRALVQADGRFYIDDGGNNRNDSFLLRRARPIIEGTLWKSIDFTLVPEFGGGSNTTDGNPSSSASILDAYLNFRYRRELQLRVGKFKSPVGLEQLQSDSQTFFTERGLPSNLTPNRDTGVMLHGETWGGAVHYAIGIFNGVGDNRNSANLDFDDEKEGATRLFFHPFLHSDWEFLRGLGAGAGASYGNQDGVSGLNSYTTEAGQIFFSYGSGSGPTAATVRADGTHWRLSPQAYYYFRCFGFLAEYAISSQEVRASASGVTAPDGPQNELQHKAWQIVGGYVLTGENASYKGVSPRKPFSLSERQWGAWELVGRYSHLQIDEQTFPVFADPARSASEAGAYSGALNWYANRNIRTTFSYVHTDFKNGTSGTVTRKDENAFLTRVQLAF